MHLAKAWRFVRTRRGTKACDFVDTLPGFILTTWKLRRGANTSFDEALKVASTDERFMATVYAMNTLLIQKGIYTKEEFESIFIERMNKEQRKKDRSVKDFFSGSLRSLDPKTSWHSVLPQYLPMSRCTHSVLARPSRHHLLFFSSLHLKLHSTVGSYIPTAIDPEVTEDMAWRLWIRRIS
jgi:hypothetical protein